MYAKISEFKHIIKSQVRLIHYTEQGMIPMSQRIEEKEKQKQKKKSSHINMDLIGLKPVKRLKKKSR